MNRQRVLITLIGEQPNPNLIPLYLDTAIDRPNVVQFMVSADTTIRMVATRLQDAIRKNSKQEQIEMSGWMPMDAWDLAKARRDLRQTLDKYPAEEFDVTVSLTGGTKIMSLAAYLTTTEAHLPMLYVNTERNEIIPITGDGVAQTPIPIKVKLPIDTQLIAAGHPMTECKKLADLNQDLIKLAEEIVNHYVPIFTALIAPLVGISANHKVGTPIDFKVPPDCKDFVERAQQFGLWKWDRLANTITLQNGSSKLFIEGKWLEDYCIANLDKSNYFDEVLGNVKMKDIPGEVDCMASVGGRLALIECKKRGDRTGDGKTFAATKLRMHDVILGGPYGISVFAVATEEPTAATEWRQICEDYQLPGLVLGGELRKLAEIVQKGLCASL